MKRGWFILLALSLGLNAGLSFVHISQWTRMRELPPMELGIPRGGGLRGPMDHPEGPPGFIRERLGLAGQRLNLNDEQVRAMSGMLEAMMPELLQRREQIRDLRMQMREEYLRPQVDALRIHEIRKETLAVQSRLDSIMVETMLKEAEVLTPKQREAYFEMMPFADKERHGARMRMGQRRSGN